MRMRSWIQAGLVVLAGLFASPALAQPADIKLVLLGTKGGPSVRSDRQFPTSNVLVINGAAYVVDTGYGVTLRMNQAKVPLQSLRYVFITHHHSDHNLDYGNLLYNAWVVGLREPVRTFGPRGFEALDRAFWEANRLDIETRISDEGRPDPRALVVARDFSEGLVMDNGVVKVTALRNRHPPIDESYALKFEAHGKTIVFSGDTAYHPPLAEFAKGADYLIHEVMDAAGIARAGRRLSTNARTLQDHLRASHTLSEDVGRIAQQAQVKNLILTHFVPADDPQITEEDWVGPARKHFGGPIILGRDLLEVPIR